MAMIRVSDISGDRDAQLTTLSINGVHYEIDLTNEEIDGLKHELGRFLAVARSQLSASSGGSFDAKEVRAWAQAHGLEMNPQGRIPKAIVAQWRNR